MEIPQIISQLHKSIEDIELELVELGEPVLDMPELIISANLLRSNQYLAQLSQKQSRLLFAYSTYSNALDDTISVLFDVNEDLKNLLRKHSNLISSEKSRQKLTASKNKKKSSIKKTPRKKLTNKEKIKFKDMKISMK